MCLQTILGEDRSRLPRSRRRGRGRVSEQSPAPRSAAPRPSGLRERPVRPRAPCPVARRAPLWALGAPAPSSFQEPTLIKATITIELRASAWSSLY